jgi:hypothetical protein
MDSPAETNAAAAGSPILETTVFLLNRHLPLYLFGGPLALCALKAWLFYLRGDSFYLSLSGFYEWLGIIMAAVGTLLHLFPPKLVFTPTHALANTFWIQWFEIPWAAVGQIELFRSPVVQTMGAWGKAVPSGGGRNLGIRLKAEWIERVRTRSGQHGYHAVIPSMWDVPIARVAEEAERCWRAGGGAGGIEDRIPKRAILANVANQSDGH